MDAEALRQVAEQAGPNALWLGLVAGFLFSFNPVALAAIPVSLAYVTKSRSRREALLLAGLFVAGMVATHGVLGFAASLGGGWVQDLFGRAWGLLLGPLLIALGLLWPGWLRIRLPTPGFRARPVAGAWGAFALGVPFAVAVCPVCTPALVVLLGVAAAIGAPGFGTSLLLAFALGRAVPVALGAFAVGWLEHLSALGRAHHALEIFGGSLLVLSGLYLLNAYFVVVPGLAG